jgi:hypothetical protein
MNQIEISILSKDQLSIVEIEHGKGVISGLLTITQTEIKSND